MLLNSLARKYTNNYPNRTRVVFLLIFACIFATPFAQAQKGEFLTTAEFHSLAFPNQELPWQTLWVNQTQRAAIKNILNHSAPGLRIRYKGDQQKTAWIFEEVGKELPITIGVVVEAGKIQQLHVLSYRESRGGEVRHNFFTQQFKNAALDETKNKTKLDQHIDGITGATLSVRALKKIATLALYCHTQTPFASPQVAATQPDNSNTQ